MIIAAGRISTGFTGVTGVTKFSLRWSVIYSRLYAGMHGYLLENAPAATSSNGFSCRRNRPRCATHAGITADSGRRLARICSNHAHLRPRSAKQPVAMFYTQTSVRQVGLASNDSLRKRSINECQAGGDEAHSSKVRIDSRGSEAREASLGLIRLPYDKAGSR